MKYNILSVASRSYFPFVDIFINSLHKNLDLDKINKIYIVLIDMKDMENKLSFSEKIIFLHYDTEKEFLGVHSDGWYDTVKKKTFFLKEIISNISENESLILIDSDTMIIQDFYEIINKDFDLQITQMSSKPHLSASGIIISHIASFMIFNNIPKSKLFIEKWIKNIELLDIQNKKRPHETPAMNMTLCDEQIVSFCKIESLNEKIVCSDSLVGPETKVLHYKSVSGDSNSRLQNFENRLSAVKYFEENMEKINYRNFLKFREYSEWKKNSFKKIVYSFCDGGLGNRLGSLVGAMHLCERIGSELVILWPKTRWCDAEFIDFFEPSQKYITCESDVKKIVQRNAISICDTHIKHDLPNLRHIYPENDSFESFGKYEKILHSNNTPYHFMDEDRISSLLSKLKINKNILERVSKFVLENKIDDSVLGLHIRKTDHQLLPDSFYYNFIESQQDKKIFVCSDDEKIENDLSSKYENIITRKKQSYVQKYQVGDWRIGDEFNVYRSKNSVIDGFVDMLILSKTSIVKVSDASTFLKFALHFKKYIHDSNFEKTSK